MSEFHRKSKEAKPVSAVHLRVSLVLAGFLVMSGGGSSLAQELVAAPPNGCETIVEMDGFLSRAQFQCGLQNYSEELLQTSRSCAKSISSVDLDGLLRKGMGSFDLEEKRKGRPAVCQDAAKRLTRIVSGGLSSELPTQPQMSNRAEKDIDYDVKTARGAAIFKQAVWETRACLNEAVQTSLQLGWRNREDIVSWSSRMCGAKLMYAYKVIGRTDDEGRAYLRTLANDELNAVTNQGR